MSDVSQEEKVLALFRGRAGGLTDFELEQESGLSHQSATARRHGLVRRRLLANSGAKRLTGTGRLAVVWIDAALVAELSPVEAEDADVEEAPMRSARRVEFEKRMDAAEPLLLQGKSNVEIAAVLGVSSSSVSNAKRALEHHSRTPTKLDRDLDRFDAALSATTAVAAGLAKRLEMEATTKPAEELKKCGKNLADSLRQLRELQVVLKRMS